MSEVRPAEHAVRNVVVVNDYAFVNGGASQVALTTAAGMAGRGYRVHLFSGVGPPDPSLAGQANLQVTCLGQYDLTGDPVRPRAFVNGLWNRSAAQRLDEILRTLDPAESVVHIHGWTKNLTASVASRCIQRGVRTIATLHDYFLACPNGGFYNYPRGENCPLRGLSLPCLLRNCDARSYPQKLWRFARQSIQVNFGRMPGGLRDYIAVSDFSAAILRPYLPEGSTVWRVNNPVDVERGEPVDVAQNTPVIAVGRFSPEKGMALLAKAVKIAGAQALFVGDGPEREKIAAEAPPEWLTGWLPHDGVISRLAQAKALALPSLCYEVSPLTVMEAAARGVPSIVPHPSAASELVVDGETGLHFRSGDAKDLAEKIVQINQPGVAEKLGSAVYAAYWKDPWSTKIYLDRVEAVYQRSAKDHR